MIVNINWCVCDLVLFKISLDMNVASAPLSLDFLFALLFISPISTHVLFGVNEPF